MLLSIQQSAGCPLTHSNKTKHFHAPNVNSAEVEKPELVGVTLECDQLVENVDKYLWVLGEMVLGMITRLRIHGTDSVVELILKQEQ